MLVEQTLFGEVDKVKKAIDRLKAFEPQEGYYLAFSGGKDSQCIYHLAKEAGVQFDAHYNITGIDPPELVYFIRSNYPDVHLDMYEKSMWKLIVERVMPPTQMVRYCCQELKERGGEGRVCVTGVRWAESVKRKNNRNAFEVITNTKKNKMLFNDNEDGRKLFENCMQKGKRVVNPIVDWEDEDVWKYLNGRNIPHCSLYNEGFHRLGCIGCPMASTQRTEREFLRWPKIKDAYIRAFQRMVEERTRRGLKTNDKWKTGLDVMEWWVYGKVRSEKPMEGQIHLWDEEEADV